MKRFHIILVYIICSLFFSSCVNRKELATNAVNELFSYIKNDKDNIITEIYPAASNLPSYYKSDNIKINEVKRLNDKKIAVLIENNFTNGFGKSFNRDITLYLEPSPSDPKKYIIYDSEGFCGYEDNSEFKIAVKSGCIDNKAYKTDEQIAKKLVIAKAMMFNEYVNVYSELKSKVLIKNWSWETSYYGNSANGQGICINKSTFTIPKPKYKIVYKDRNGNAITDDDGYITYDALSPGSSKAFTFYTSYVGNASKASISVEFDDDLIFDYIVSKNYTGNEYAEYMIEQNNE